VGRNNVGKSRILRALHIAIRGIPVESDDLTVGLNESAEIDLVVAPHPSGMHLAELPSEPDSIAKPVTKMFDESLQGVFGDGLSVVSTDPTQQRYAWRTIIEPATEGRGARSQTQVLAYSVDTSEWQPQQAMLPGSVRCLVHAELVETSRDLDDELRRRGTAIRRILNDLQVESPQRESLEQQLAELGEDILGNSKTLSGLRDSLNSLDHYVDAVGSAQVDPVPRTLEELARSVGVSFDDGSEPLASRLHGSGVRSLASLLVQDVFYRQALGADGGDIRPHPVTLIEEPEAHLHPHAILEVSELLESEDRQVVATTHSPMLASAVTPQCLRLLRRDGTGGYGAIDFGPTQHEKDVPRTKNPHFYASEMEKLKRLVERPFSELLFARAVVIGDGATERAFFPPILRAALGSRAHGISVIDSGGMNNNLVSAVIKFARHAEFPIVIFADSDTAGAERVRQLVGQSKLDESTEVVWASESSTHADSSQQDRSVAIERMMIDASSEACKAACKAMGTSVADETDERDLLSALQDHKGAIGTTLAKEFLSTHPYTDGSNWPKPLRELTELMKARLNETPATAPEVAP